MSKHGQRRHRNYHEEKEIRNYTHIYATLPASRAEEPADAAERAWR